MSKKNILILFLMLTVFLLSGQMTSAQTADFDALSMKPGFYEGVSEPKPSEAEALLDARNSALRKIASSFSSFVTGIYGIKMIGKGTNPADVIVTTTGDASVVVRLPLTGVEEAGKKVEKTEDGYIARVLLTLSKEGRLNAEKFVDREATAFRAYRYFAGKFKLAVLTLTDVPSGGYSDYSSWLENNCLIFEMKSSGENDYLIQLDAFLRKLSRSIVIFTDNYDKKPVRIVYNAPDRFQEVVTALQKNHVKVSRENSRLLLSPDISLEEFKRQVDKMPDAGKILITGISSYDNRNAHISSLALNEAAHIAEQNFGMNAQTAQLPDHFLNGTYNDMQRINMLDRGNARYVLLLKSTAVLEPGIEAYKIPPYYRISYRAVLFDSLTEKIVYSDVVQDASAYIYGTSSVGFIETYSKQLTLNLEKIINGVLENL